MIRRLLFVVSGFFLFNSVAPALTLEQGDAGQAYQFQNLRSSFVIINDGKDELEGVTVKPLRPYDRVISAPQRIAAGAHATVEVDLFVSNDIGVRGHSFSVATSAGKEPVITRIRLYGLSVLQDPERILDFETVAAGTAPTIDYALATDDPTIHITAIKEVPDFATATIKEGGRGLVLRHRENSAWGKLSGLIKVQLDSAQQREAWIPVHTEVRGDVLPSSMNFELGVARMGQRNEYILQYRHGAGKDFALDKAVLEGIRGKTTVQDCVGGEKGCKQVRFVIDDKQPQGQISGKLRVHLPDYDRELIVTTGGMLLSKNIKVQSLDEALAASAKSKPEGEANLSQALNRMKAAEQPVEAVIPPGNGPLLRWSVDNETLIYGYVAYRADSENGPFLPQGEVVRKSASSKALVTSHYAFRDNDVVAGKAYWYRIATLYTDGKREFLSDPQRVTAAAGSGQKVDH